MKTMRIEDVSEFVLDGTHGSPVRVESGVPVLSAQNVKNGVLNYDTDRFTNDEEYRAFKARLPLRVGDLLLTIVGTIGRAAVVTEVRPLVFQRSVAVIRPRNSVLDSRFFFHATQVHDFQSQLSRSSNTSSQAGVYLGKIKEVTIPLPPLPAQRRIAEVLDLAEALRAKRRAALAELDELTQSIFLDMFGDPHGYAKYSQCVLSECAKVVSGIAKGRKLDGKRKVLAPYLRVANVQAGFLDLSEIKTIEALPEEVTKLALEPGDVLLTEGGDHDKLGRGALWEGEIDGCIHQNHIFRVRPNQSQLLPNFFHEFIQTTEVRAYFLGCAKRTTNLASINMTQLRALPVFLPPLSLQREFAKRVAAVERVKAAQRASLAELDELFAALQQRAFRGEL